MDESLFRFAELYPPVAHVRVQNRPPEVLARHLAEAYRSARARGVAFQTHTHTDFYYLAEAAISLQATGLLMEVCVCVCQGAKGEE